ncbi:hypothetical protein POM88_021018 [Heracleum sosnowskyi]|uniref:Uncharacterized protein n=1 Tax=Heracleum sosnowskyi TaxID=360622 RepID=A0AAD8MTE7_9APIA|nr:hypothetical protein POM88_021018 [Heracleum sosnowskyi]
MGPLRGMNGFQAQLWAVHLAMYIAFKKKIHHVIVETNNVSAFDILLDPDEDIVEKEGLWLNYVLQNMGYVIALVLYGSSPFGSSQQHLVVMDDLFAPQNALKPVSQGLPSVHGVLLHLTVIYVGNMKCDAF